MQGQPSHPSAPEQVPQSASQKSFLRTVLTMLTGTVLAQGVPMLVAPVLTRLYQPAEYGVYASFMLVAYTISTLASARYEHAIMLPDDEHEALNVVGLCVLSATIVAVLAAIAVVVLRIAGVTGVRIGPYMAAVPPMVFLMSVYETLSYWILRKQRFARLSVARVLRAIITASANIGFGLMAFRGGLVASTLLGHAIATLALGVQLLKDPAARIQNVRLSTIFALAKRYRQFPLFALPAEFMSTLAVQLPVAFFDATSAGLFTFVQTVMNAPLSVAAGSALDAFKERATRDYRERGNFRDIFVKLAWALAALALPPIAVLAVWGPPLFAFVFGEAWRAGGHVARLLAIMYLFKFVASPLSYSFHIARRQGEDFLLHAYILASTALILTIGIRMFHDFERSLIAFALNYTLYYTVYIIRSYQFSRGTLTGARSN